MILYYNFDFVKQLKTVILADGSQISPVIGASGNEDRALPVAALVEARQANPGAIREANPPANFTGSHEPILVDFADLLGSANIKIAAVANWA